MGLHHDVTAARRISLGTVEVDDAGVTVTIPEQWRRELVRVLLTNHDNVEVAFAVHTEGSELVAANEEKIPARTGITERVVAEKWGLRCRTGESATVGVAIDWRRLR